MESEGNDIPHRPFGGRDFSGLKLRDGVGATRRSKLTMRKILGGALAVVALGSGIVFGVWAAILELRLLYAVGGFWLAVAGFLVLPPRRDEGQPPPVQA